MKLPFPQLLLPIGLYNLLAVVTSVAPSLAGATKAALDKEMFAFPMPAPGSQFEVSFGCILLFVGLICLFFELISATSGDDEALLGDTISLLLFIVCLLEFILLPPFMTQTFFLLTVMVLMDAMASFIISTVSARKDIAFGK